MNTLDAATPRPWRMHDEHYCPEEIWGSLDGPLEDGRIHGQYVCLVTVVEDDSPTTAANAALICRAVNAWDDVLALEARIGELMRDDRATFKALTEQHPDPFTLTPLEREIQYTNPEVKPAEDNASEH